jgi:hypothetical protein
MVRGRIFLISHLTNLKLNIVIFQSGIFPQDKILDDSLLLDTHCIDISEFLCVKDLLQGSIDGTPFNKRVFIQLDNGRLWCPLGLLSMTILNLDTGL